VPIYTESYPRKREYLLVSLKNSASRWLLLLRTYPYIAALKVWLIIDFKPKGKCLIFVVHTFRISSKNNPTW